VSLEPRAVAARLADLRVCHRPETVEEAAARLAAEVPAPAAAPFHEAVAARLAELRALCELARHLHRED
jgi:hypothetical protein